MRYVIYNKETGKIVHTHQSFRLDSDIPQEVEENEIRMVLNRFEDAKQLDLTKTTVPQVSSRQAEMFVNVKTGEIEVKQLIDDPLSRRLADLHGKEKQEEE